MPIIRAKEPSPLILNKGFIKLLKSNPKLLAKFVYDNNSVATKKGKRDGIIEFANRLSPVFAADKLVLENNTRKIVNIKNTKGNM